MYLKQKKRLEDTKIENDWKRAAVGPFETEFPEEASEQRPEWSESPSHAEIWRSAFQEEGTAHVKALR